MAKEDIKFKYHYKGPVYSKSGKWMGGFEGYTIAKTVHQAMNNLSFQAKKKYGLMPSSYLLLPYDNLERIDTIKAATYHQMELFEMENFNV